MAKTATLLAAPEEAIARLFVREYVDNGLAVYDAANQRLGMVSDIDRPGGGFVVRLPEPGRFLFIPMRFLKSVRRGRAYLSELSCRLTRSPL